jgi:cell division protein FtsI/penicillin-binding protein 2
MNSRRRILALAATAVAVVPLVSCSAAPPKPDATAQAFLAALSTGDTAAAGAVTDQPDAARAVLTMARDALKPESVQATVTQVQTSGDTATASFDATWSLPNARRWAYSGQFPLTRTSGGWQVRWSSADLHPQLAANQTLAVRSAAAPTAAVLDRNGAPVLTPGAVIAVTIDPVKAGDLGSVAASLAAALGRFDPAITQASIQAGVAKSPAAPYVVVTLREPDYQSVKAAIYDLPGVSFPAQAALLAPDRTLAPTLLRQVRDRVQADLTGKAGWKLVTVGPGGNDVTVLTEGAPQPAPAVTVTLDTRVLAAAQAAVNAVPQQAMVVALQASTGEVLAVAQNPPADTQGAVALTGLYPPGSTFKIVTATAALQAGIATVSTAVDCPGTTVVGQRRIPNYNEFSLGTVPLSTAFARSCNTSFAQLAAQLAPPALTDAARELSLGADYVLDGAGTVTGRVPPAADQVTRAVDGFGQGDVLASPFGMALVAASVSKGSAASPVLIRGGAATTVTGQPAPPPQPVLDGVRSMMREVVTAGTATGVSNLGAVFGKTGEAQFGDGTRSHSWFVGYRGDLAFATLIVDGGSSTNAVNLTKQFLAALPAGS